MFRQELVNCESGGCHPGKEEKKQKREKSLSPAFLSTHGWRRAQVNPSKNGHFLVIAVSLDRISHTSLLHAPKPRPIQACSFSELWEALEKCLRGSVGVWCYENEESPAFPGA